MAFRMETNKHKLKVILTGATGMVGEGVLHESLAHPDVEQVLVIGREPCGVTHVKLKELVVPDLYDLSAISEELGGFDACFFCLGISSAGMSEAEYSQITYDLTMYVAGLLSGKNEKMVFCYVTAGGTDTGKSMWARVKRKTENELLKLPFKKVYMFRPGYIHPTKGLKNAHRYYAALTWLYPLIRRLMPKHVITLSELGKAMVHVVQKGNDTPYLDSRDMARLSR
ncbi:epimerase [Paenibacillus sp. 2TAB23]|uniref:epimerase n=1 Tax=Paenibacillus sp. 2TAB23 TaxID=3233004 RepID=UPI003F962DA3